MLILNIWEILGIEPGAGAEAIRIAYSTKVKDVHPEDDPEGFMRLRKAYEEALQISAGRSAMLDAVIFPDNGEILETSNFDFEETVPLIAYQNIEQYADEYRLKEKHIADSYINEIEVLRDSSDFDNIEAWRTLLSGPVFDKLMRSEYFTRSFFEFLRASRYPFSMPEDVRTQLLIPLIGEWRSYWQGSELSGVFDVIWRKKLSKDSEKVPDIILGIHSASIFISSALGLMVMIIFRLINRPNDPDLAIVYFTRNYNRFLGWTMMLAITVIICIGLNAFCFFMLRRYVKGRDYAVKKKTNSSIYLVVHIFLVLIIAFFLPRVASWAPKWAADLQQIKENQLSTSSVYISADDRRYTDFREIVINIGELYRGLKIMPGLDFDPSNERRQYFVSYTDQLVIIVSISTKAD